MAGVRDGKQRVTKSKVPTPLGFVLRSIHSAHPYLARRGIEQRTAAGFGVGIYRGPGVFCGRLVISIHNQRGELVAYCGRAPDRSEPRYRFPPSFAKSEILFNLHRAAATAEQTVVLVEGFFDCMKVYQACTGAVVALMGAVLYPSQQRSLLERFRRVILMLDGDSAAQRATATIAARLRPHCALQVIYLPAQTQPEPAFSRRDSAHSGDRRQ